MGNCKYCGQPAGFFSSKHKECEIKHSQGLHKIVDLLKEHINGRIDSSLLRSEVNTLKRDNYLSQEDIETSARAVIADYTSQIHRPFNVDPLSPILSLIRALSMRMSSLNTDGTIDSLAQKLIRGYLVEYFTGVMTLSSSEQKVSSVVSLLSTPDTCLQEAIYYVLNKAATNFLKDGILTDKEESLIRNYKDKFGVSFSNLPTAFQNSNIEKIEQSAILKNLEKGIYPNQVTGLPIVLRGDEFLLWTYDGVTCYQEKVEKEYVGRHNGVNIRIIKGVYYRIGQSKGKPVEHSYMNNIGTGTLFVTNKNLIFYSTLKSIKIPFTKLLGISPYSDGMEIHLEGANTKRTAMTGLDCWFLMNLIPLINN